jgi:hypothetical protein
MRLQRTSLSQGGDVITTPGASPKSLPCTRLIAALRRSFGGGAAPRALTALASAAWIATATGDSAAVFPAEFRLPSLLIANGGDGSEGFALQKSSGALDAVSGVGDVNGDGMPDSSCSAMRRASRPR